MLISVVINCDSRPERDLADGLFSGVVNEDFLVDGIRNKVKFFEGFETETIVFIDEHLRVEQKIIEFLRSIVDTVIIRKHTNEEKFNDNNYIAALSLARGDYIAHFDQDTSCFTSSKESIQEMINLLEQHDYVSYPSRFSPNPDQNPNYDYYWCSTRFFMCKRETIDFSEIKKCLIDSDYLYEKYPASVRNPWMEHILALISKYTGKGVFYPPIDIEKYVIFSWANYQKWTLRRLNEYTYDQIKEFINQHPIGYPNDITI